jgi:hypothetical protein
MQTEPAYPVYQIKIEGLLDPRWSAWLDGFTVIQAGENPGCTTITGCVADQAALRGILNKLWDLNLTLISINRLS